MSKPSFDRCEVVILTGPEFERLRGRADVSGLEFIALDISGEPNSRISSDAMKRLSGREIGAREKPDGRA